MSKKRWIVVGIVVVVAGLGLSVWQMMAAREGAAAQELAATETAQVRRDTLVIAIEGTGSLSPREEVELAFLSGGQVSEILVEEGQVVEEGQPLIRLEVDELELEVARAKAMLAAAEGQLAQLLTPPPAEEIAAQEANLAAIQGQVSAAVANRDQVIDGPDEAQIAAAAAQVAAAERDHKSALIRYDSIDEADEERKEEARYDLWAAEVALEAANTQLSVLLDGAGAEEVRVAQADVAAAIAQRDAAQAQLDQLLAGATEEDIQAEKAAVTQARVALDQARLRLDRATLTAPMDGTVVSLDVTLGEKVNPTQPVITLSDLSALEVEVNLDEADVVQVAIGQEVQVSVEAFPDIEMTGELAYIAPVAQAYEGVVYYPVTIHLASGSLHVRAGMTADVSIITAQQENVLIVPFRAVKTEEERTYVDCLREGRVERVEVTLGTVTDTEIEIVEGLSEGEEVLVISGPVRESDPPLPPVIRALHGEG